MAMQAIKANAEPFILSARGFFGLAWTQRSKSMSRTVKDVWLERLRNLMPELPWSLSEQIHHLSLYV